MPATDLKTHRIELAREARRVAEEIEGLMLQTAKALRCYAGTKRFAAIEA
jgi:hypothetical protein